MSACQNFVFRFGAATDLVPDTTLRALYVLVSPNQSGSHRSGGNYKGLGHKTTKEQGQDDGHRDRLDRFPPTAIGRLGFVRARGFGRFRSSLSFGHRERVVLDAI